jgi:hypothetical protein
MTANPAVYFAIWAAVALGTSVLLLVRREPGFRIRWHARIVLGANVAVGIGMFLLIPDPVVWVLTAVGGGFITYLSITKMTICSTCGRIIQPVRLVSKAEFCPHCGGKTVVSKVFRG